MIIQTTDSTFQTDVLSSSLPVLVDFWAPWCGPCKMLTPIIEDLARELDTIIQVAQLNIDENPTIPSQQGIRTIPTLILYHQGNVLGTQIGLQDKEVLLKWVNNLLPSSTP